VRAIAQNGFIGVVIVLRVSRWHAIEGRIGRA